MLAYPIAQIVPVEGIVCVIVDLAVKSKQFHLYPEEVYHDLHRRQTAAKIKLLSVLPLQLVFAWLKHALDFQKKPFSCVLFAQCLQCHGADAFAAAVLADGKIVDKDQLIGIDGDGKTGKCAVLFQTPDIHFAFSVHFYDYGKGLSFRCRKGGKVQFINFQPASKVLRSS